jgi:hypothetical protein
MWPVMTYDGTVFTCLPAWAHVWLAGPAVFVLCRRGLDGRVTLLHIGETADLSSGIGGGDPHWDAAIRLGMSEIHVHALANGVAARQALAARLRQRYATPLDPENPVHRAQARLATALAAPSRRAMTVLDWIEALVVARPPAAAEGWHPAPATPPAPIRGAPRAVSGGRG